MYRIYTTHGIVLRRFQSGEANLVLKVLTRELGLVSVSVQGSRRESSKLRSAIQDFSLFQMSAVKGKNGWRMTSAVSETNLFFEVPEYARKTLAQISDLCLKLMPGESPHSEVFDLVRSGFKHLPLVPEHELALFEALLVLRLLNFLGYIERDLIVEEFLMDSNDWNDGLLKSVAHKKSQIIEKINHALSASQL